MIGEENILDGVAINVAIQIENDNNFSLKLPQEKLDTFVLKLEKLRVNSRDHFHKYVRVLSKYIKENYL